MENKQSAEKIVFEMKSMGFEAKVTPMFGHPEFWAVVAWLNRPLQVMEVEMALDTEDLKVSQVNDVVVLT